MTRQLRALMAQLRKAQARNDQVAVITLLQRIDAVGRW